jgi:hypothetical protein
MLKSGNHVRLKVLRVQREGDTLHVWTLVHGTRNSVKGFLLRLFAADKGSAYTIIHKSGSTWLVHISLPACRCPRRDVCPLASPSEKVFALTLSIEKGRSLALVMISSKKMLQELASRGYKIVAVEEDPAADELTPDTVDVDSLIDGLVEAERAGVQVEVDVEVIRSFWEASRRRRVLEALEEAPMSVDLLAQALGIPLKRAQSAVQWLLSRGYLVYIHTPYGRVYAPKHAVDKPYRLHGDYLKPKPGLEVQVRPHTSRGPLRSIRGGYHRVKERLERLLEKHGDLERLTAHARLRVGAVETIAQAAYHYRIDDEHILKLVLDNLFSIRRWHRFHALNRLN